MARSGAASASVSPAATTPRPGGAALRLAGAIREEHRQPAQRRRRRAGGVRALTAPPVSPGSTRSGGRAPPGCRPGRPPRGAGAPRRRRSPPARAVPPARTRNPARGRSAARARASAPAARVRAAAAPRRPGAARRRRSARRGSTPSSRISGGGPGTGSASASWRASAVHERRRAPRCPPARPGRRARGSRPSPAAGAGAASTSNTCSRGRRRRRARRRANAAKSSKSRHRARRARARPAAHRDLARRGEAGVAPVAVRRVGGQRLSSARWRRSPLKARIAVSASGIPTWTCSAADRRGDRVAEQVADALVALLVGDLRLALARRSDACRCPASAGAGREHGPRAARAGRPIASAAVSQTSVMSSS